jgi:hypothetical protein
VVERGREKRRRRKGGKRRRRSVDWHRWSFFPLHLHLKESNPSLNQAERAKKKNSRYSAPLHTEKTAV